MAKVIMNLTLMLLLATASKAQDMNIEFDAYELGISKGNGMPKEDVRDWIVYRKYYSWYMDLWGNWHMSGYAVLPFSNTMDFTYREQFYLPVTDKVCYAVTLVPYEPRPPFPPLPYEADYYAPEQCYEGACHDG